jgi:hypothetical protein
MRGVVEEIDRVCGQWAQGKGGSMNAEGGKGEEGKRNNN